MKAKHLEKCERWAGYVAQTVPMWPWNSRGREAVTAESVRRELAGLRAMVAARMRSTHTGGRASVAIDGEGWA